MNLIYPYKCCFFKEGILYCGITGPDLLLRSYVSRSFLLSSPCSPREVPDRKVLAPTAADVRVAFAAGLRVKREKIL